MPKISIIVPVYNTETYLEQCLTSCVNQTLKDIEIICVNDGSTDNSLNIINAYANKDNRVIIVNQDNQGLSMARNNGLDIASGEYILFLDADDWLDLNACYLAYNQAHKNDNDVLIFNYYNYLEGKDKYFASKLNINKLIGISNINLKKINNINHIQAAYVWNKIYKRKWLIKNDIKFIKMEWEDLPFSIKIVIHSESASVIKDNLYYYRYRDNSLTRRVSCLGAVKSKDLSLCYVLKTADLNLLKVYLNYYFEAILFWYDNLPKDKNQKAEYKQAMFNSFKKVEQFDYRAKLYRFIINTRVYIIYKIIKCVNIFLKHIFEKYCLRYQEEKL